MQPMAPLRCPAAALATQGASCALGRQACPALWPVAGRLPRCLTGQSRAWDGERTVHY